jgi:hypothetical protein
MLKGLDCEKTCRGIVSKLLAVAAFARVHLVVTAVILILVILICSRSRYPLLDALYRGVFSVLCPTLATKAFTKRDPT